MERTSADASCSRARQPKVASAQTAIIPRRSICLNNGFTAIPFCAGYISVSSSQSDAALAGPCFPPAVAESHLSGSQPYFPFPVFPQSRSKWGHIPAVFFILQLAGSNSSLWVSPGISAEIPSSRLVNRSSFKTLSLSPKWKSILQV